MEEGIVDTITAIVVSIIFLVLNCIAAFIVPYVVFKMWAYFLNDSTPYTAFMTGCTVFLMGARFFKLEFLKK